MGVAAFPNDATDPWELLGKNVLVMYRDKRAGGPSVAPWG